MILPEFDAAGSVLVSATLGAMLILDFDGTITDAEAEGMPYRRGYLEDIAELTGQSAEDIFVMAAGFEADIAADPHHNGWELDGHIVAPAMVDPYLRVIPVARRIFDELGAFRDAGERRRLQQILYKYNYPKTNIAFRDGARELLLGLAGTSAYVVTNSHTESVQSKIRTLGPEGELEWLLARVRGGAKKYVVDDELVAIERELHLSGLDRPVLLRRRNYHEVINALLAAESTSIERLIVVGDIFELDLALPLAMGARVVLVSNHFTPEYEKRFVETHPRGCLIEHLSELPAIIQSA